MLQKLSKVFANLQKIAAPALQQYDNQWVGHCMLNSYSRLDE